MDQPQRVQERMSARPSPAATGFRSRGSPVRPETLRRRGEREAGNKSFIFSMKDGLLPLQTEASILGNKTLFMSRIDGRCTPDLTTSGRAHVPPAVGFRTSSRPRSEHAMRVALRPAVELGSVRVKCVI